MKRSAGDSPASARCIHLLPASCSGRIATLPPPDRPVLQHEVSGHEAAAALHQPGEERVRDAEWRVGDDVEVAARQTEVGGVGFDDDDGVAELSAEERRPPRVELDCDDPRAGLDEWPRERAEAGSHVENEVSGPQSGVSDELRCPAGIELMPSPCLP